MIRIIGAGFSGLSLAYHFVKRGYAVTIVEKRANPGGVIQTDLKNGLMVESAANGLLASRSVEELFLDIGVELLQTKSESRRKYIYRNGLRRWPLNFRETLDLIIRFSKAYLQKNHKPREGETLKAFGQRILGPAGDSYLIQPMVNGIFAENTEKLDAGMIVRSMFFPKVRGALKGLLSAPAGMGEIITKLELYLKARGVTFEYGKDEKFDLKTLQHNTFLAVDFSTLRSTFENQEPKTLSTKRNDLRSLSLARVTLNFKKTVKEIDGFGVLFPNVEKFNALGVLANTKIFENRGEYNESWIFSDSTMPELMSLSDQQFKEKIIQDRKRLFSDDFEIDQIHLHRWPQVVPCYNRNLKEFIHSNPALSWQLAGNYLGVLGLTGIHERNAQLVTKYRFEEKRKQ